MLYGQSSSFRCSSWWDVPDVFYQLAHGAKSCVRWEYLELVPGEKLRYTDAFDDPNLPGEIVVTIILKQVSVGTELHIETNRLARRDPE